jgi:antitoxin CptB
VADRPSSAPTDGAAPAPFADVARERLKNKLEWRCRRGMKELDLLLLRYLRGRHAQASSEERAAFEQFLELPDPQIARYLIGGDLPDDPSHAALCQALRQPD